MPVIGSLLSLPRRPVLTGNVQVDLQAIADYIPQLERALFDFGARAFQNDVYQANLSGGGQLFPASVVGYQQLPKISGRPAAVPLPLPGYSPIAFDPAAHRLYCYSSDEGRWYVFCPCDDYGIGEVDEALYWASSDRPRLPYLPDEGRAWMTQPSGAVSTGATGIDGGLYWMYFEGGSFPLQDMDDAIFWMTN